MKKNTLSQDDLNKVFESDLGQQIDTFYVCNNLIFIRIEEAYQQQLSSNCEIDEYFAEYSGKDKFPIARKF